MLKILYQWSSQTSERTQAHNATGPDEYTILTFEGRNRSDCSDIDCNIPSVLPGSRQQSLQNGEQQTLFRSQKGDHASAANYRPVYLMSVCSKVLSVPAQRSTWFQKECETQLQTTSSNL